MRFNTPDNILLDDEKVLHWADKDTVPFFVLPNGKIITCPPETKHNDYIEQKFKDKNKQRSFINSVIMQGRYWKNSNIFAFWNINEDNRHYLNAVIKKLSPSPYTSKVYFNNVIYTLNKSKDGYEWVQEDKKEKPNKDIALTDDKKRIIKHWINSDMEFIDNSYVMSEKTGNKLSTRKLNNFELLAATCFQLWTDFFMNPYSKFDKFTLDELMLYIDLKYHGRVSFKELFEYFHQHMRKKMIPSHSENDYQSDEMNSENDFESLMETYKIPDSQYTIIYYEDSDEPYSCNVRIDDYKKASEIINDIKTKGNFIIDRFNTRKIKDNLTIYSFRIRKAVKMNENMRKNIKMTESNFYGMIENAVIKVLREAYDYDYDDLDIAAKHEIPSIMPNNDSSPSYYLESDFRKLKKEISDENKFITVFKCYEKYGYFYVIQEKNKYRGTFAKFEMGDNYAPANIGNVSFIVYPAFKGTIDTNTGKITSFKR